MKSKIVLVVLISLLFVTGLLFVGCIDGCKKDGECVILNSYYHDVKLEYVNCVMLTCDVSNSHLDAYYIPGRHVRCSCL